jgi:hypothetical protein
MTHSKEINERSPLRLLDRTLHGGLPPGNLGVACAGPGAGKSAFLVAIALDHLMRGKQVLHVALDHPVERVRDYYDEIFAEMSREEQLEDVAGVRAGIERNRRIHAYAPHAFEVAKLDKTLSFLEDHTAMHPDLIVVDGYDWSRADAVEIAGLKQLAADREAELWMSARLDRDLPVTHPRGYPEPLGLHDKLIDVLLRLKGADGTVHVQLLKDHDHPVQADVALDLDPTTLLLKRAGV